MISPMIIKLQRMVSPRYSRYPPHASCIPHDTEHPHGTQYTSHMHHEIPHGTEHPYGTAHPHGTTHTRTHTHTHTHTRYTGCFTFLLGAAFISFSFCSIITSCSESPIAKKLLFGSFLIIEILRPGWYCLNSPVSFLQGLNFASTPLIITGILFYLYDLGHTGVPRGDSGEPGLCWFGSIREMLALTLPISTNDLNEPVSLMTWWILKNDIKQNLSWKLREIRR